MNPNLLTDLPKTSRHWDQVPMSWRVGTVESGTRSNQKASQASKLCFPLLLLFFTETVGQKAVR